MQRKWNPVLWPTIITFLIGATIVFWALRSIRGQTRQDISGTLHAVLVSTQDGLNIWTRHHKARVKGFADLNELSSAVHKQLTIAHDQSRLKASGALRRIENLLQPAMQSRDYSGFSLFSIEGINIADSHREKIGKKLNFATLQKNNAFSSEQPSLILPFLTTNSDSQPLTMMVTAPIFDENRKVIALLGFNLDPSLEFTHMTQLGRTGETGETYAFNRHGQMITESRFFDSMRKIGLIGPEARGILTVELRNPGGNLIEGFHALSPRSEQPLTRMAQSAVQGNSGLDLNGYRDYRGVMVTGAWLWDQELGFGLTTEIDYAEAYHSYFLTLRLIFFMISVIVAGAILVIGILIQKSNTLEKTVKQLENTEQQLQRLERAPQLGQVYTNNV